LQSFSLEIKATKTQNATLPTSKSAKILNQCLILNGSRRNLPEWNIEIKYIIKQPLEDSVGYSIDESVKGILISWQGAADRPCSIHTDSQVDNNIREILDVVVWWGVVTITFRI